MKILQNLLKEMGIAYHGPYLSLEEALLKTVSEAREGDAVVFSPGCTSFGMFLNEFDRGMQYKALVKRITEEIL